MKKDKELLKRFYELRYDSGKKHLFYRINKLISIVGNGIKLEKVYVSKEYLSYLFAFNNFFIFTTEFSRHFTIRHTIFLLIYT